MTEQQAQAIITAQSELIEYYERKMGRESYGTTRGGYGDCIPDELRDLESRLAKAKGTET